MAARILIFIFILTRSSLVDGQVIISLLFGDKLNTGKVEFGLDGGINFPTLTTVPGAKTFANFNLGFYFDIRLKNSWMIHTGVLVKSNMGAEGLATYSINDPALDSSFQGGSITRKLNYFNVPIALKYLFPTSRIFLEAGPMIGLLYKAYDQFNNTVNGSELTYKVNIRDNLHALDAGLLVGAGWRLMKGNGINFAVRYYFGLTNIEKVGNLGIVRNQSLYINIGIPVGAGKAREKAKVDEPTKP
jgi:outer membrane protein with beta-barrel domain